MKKTQKVFDALRYVDDQDMGSDELERLIDELNSIHESKYQEEAKTFEEMERDKNESLNSLN